ncbi:MAG: ABC transporter ATP-binding protein [Clostridiales bacterium]|jgi:ABC-2 type transport system ATP-binding protein|nr:ABC transporter ATP-binding protein [Clostridiales bacterium]
MSVILECKSLTKKFASTIALSDLNLILERGRIVGLLGPNGSGKTTLIKLINGLLVPNSGSIHIAGMEPGVESKKIVSYLPEKTYLPDWMKVSEAINFFNDFYEDFDTNRAYDMLHRLNLDPNKRLKALSKGTKEKVQLILVMSRRAHLYCLDEPIGGVDPAARDYILSTIITNYDENATVILSTHLIADIENVLDEVIFIKEGSLVLHSPVDELREKEGKSIDSLFREVFKC